MKDFSSARQDVANFPFARFYFTFFVILELKPTRWCAMPIPMHRSSRTTERVTWSALNAASSSETGNSICSFRQCFAILAKLYKYQLSTRWQADNALINFNFRQGHALQYAAYILSKAFCVNCRVIDVGSEWRTFSNEKSGVDPSRVGGPENPLLSGGDLSTIIGPGRGDASFDSYGVSKYQNRRTISSTDRALINAFREINTMADRINLPKTIVDRANNLFKQVCFNNIIISVISSWHLET